MNDLALVVKHVYFPGPHTAASMGLVDELRRMSERGVSLDGPARADETRPLDVAIINLQAPAVQFLIESGADVNRRDEYGATPLFGAVIKWQLETIKLLLEAGADPHIATDDGRTPWTMATQKGDFPPYPEIVRLLQPYAAPE